MVNICKRFSPNQASLPPNFNTNASQYPPRPATTQMAPANQRRGGKHQFAHPPPGYPMGHPQFMPGSQAPVQYPPVTCAPPQFAPVGFNPSQCLSGVNGFRQQIFHGYPQQQPLAAAAEMSSQYYNPMNLGFQQGPPDLAMQQMMSPMNYIPPVMFGAPAQFVPPPMYSPEANMLPYNGTLPPPGFEHNMAYNGQNPNYPYDSRCTPSPSAAVCSFSPQIPPDSPIFSSIPMQPFPLFIPSQKMPNQRRPKAIAIIDPATGIDKLNEIYGTRKLESENSDAKDSNKADSRFPTSQ